MVSGMRGLNVAESTTPKTQRLRVRVVDPEDGDAAAIQTAPRHGTRPTALAILAPEMIG